MKMMKKSFFCYFVLLMLMPPLAYAELSANPWENPNSEEDIAEAFSDENGEPTQNVPGEVSKTYLKIPENGTSNDGFLGKVKNIFHSEDKSEPVNIAPNPSQQQQQQVLARRRGLTGRKKSAVRRTAGSDTGGGFLDSIDTGGFSDMMDKVKGFNMKSLTDAFK